MIFQTKYLVLLVTFFYSQFFINSAHHPRIHSVMTSSSVIDDVERKFIYFQENVAEAENMKRILSKANSSTYHDNIKNFIKQELGKEDELRQFKQLFVVYYAVEYFLNFSLCKLWNTLSGEKSNINYLTKLRSDDVFKYCDQGSKKVYRMIEAFKNIADSKVVLQKNEIPTNENKYKSEITSESDEDVPDIMQCVTAGSIGLKTYNIESLTEILQYKCVVLYRVAMNLRKLVRGIYLIHERFDDYLDLVSKEIAVSGYAQVRKDVYSWIQDVVYDELAALREFFVQPKFGKDIIDFRGNILTNEEPRISIHEQFIWRKAAKIIKDYEAEVTNTFAFLSFCERIRNELIYYAYDEIKSISSVPVKRYYEYRNYNLGKISNKFILIPEL